MKVLKPIKIGKLNLKNRYVMVAMGPELGNFNKQTNDYYVRRAEGGASMIMTNVIATEAIDGPGPSATLTKDSFQGYKDLVDRAHEYDCKVCIQIMPGIGLGGKAEDREQPASVSALPLYPGSDETFHELTKDEIKFIQEEVSKTLLLAKDAGVDAVEIHAYGGYLTDKFMTKRWNKRKDEYGGSFENRMRFLNEIIDNIKRDLGEDFPLIVKFTPSHFLPEEEGYRGIEEGIKIAKMLEEKGVHSLHVDAGCHDNWYMAMPPVYQQEMAPQMKSSKAIKEVVSIPIISQGRLGDFSKAKAALENNWLDIVGVGRQFLADPDFPNKIAENRVDEICPCISCNEGCIQSVAKGQQIDCAVNPIAGYEESKKIEKTDNPKRVLVVGAGSGGCHAAISAKLAGHNVEIWEKEDHIGGAFYSACQPAFKRDASYLFDYYKTMIDKLQIPIKFTKEANVENILAYNPDKLINALGGSPIRPGSIKGINKSHVTTARDVLEDKSLLGENIVIIGAGLVGCETGLVLDKKGKKVSLVEMADKILPEPVFIQNLMMIEKMMNESNIKAYTSSKLVEIKDKSIVMERDGKKEEIECDTVVLAMGYIPNTGIYEELKEKIDTINIGDSVKVRKVLDAVKEAHDAVLSI